MQTYRLWAAFAVLPLVDALVAFLGFPLVWYIGGHTGRPHDPAQAAGAFAILTGFFSLIVTFGGAAPAVVWLRKRGPISLGQSIAFGVILGNAPFLVFVVGLVAPLTLTHLIGGTLTEHLSPVSDLIAGTLRAVTIGTVLGAFSALVFWLVAICGTDQRTGDAVN